MFFYLMYNFLLFMDIFFLNEELKLWFLLILRENIMFRLISIYLKYFFKFWVFKVKIYKKKCLFI